MTPYAERPFWKIRDEELPPRASPAGQAMRTRACSYFETAELPSIKDENWRFTNLEPLANLDFKAVQTASTAMDVKKVLGPDEINIVLLNGVFSHELSSETLPSELSLLTGASAENFIDGSSGGYISRNDSAFLLRLNDLFFQDSLVIVVKKGAQRLPLVHLVQFQDGNAPAAIVSPRVIVAVEAGAAAAIFESSITGTDKPVFSNALLDITLAEGASLELVQSSRNGAETFRLASTRVFQEKESRLQSFVFTDGAKLFRHDLSVMLQGEGAETVINGLHRLGAGRHADSHTYVEHVAPNARSNQLYKAILEGKSHSIFNGRIYVTREAQLTNSYQLNKNLILSREARVNTKPQLEIFADDVKCSHGATIGQLDEDQLFYLETRGIDREQAVSMLIGGFIDEVVGCVKDNRLRAKLIKSME